MLQQAWISKDGGRPINEDAVAVREAGGALLCVLADGLGGHGAGEVASALAVQGALEVWNGPALPFEERLAACALAGQNAIMDEQRRTGRSEDTKTTLVLLQIEGERAQWLHVGDSRLYQFSGGRLAGRTLDHSVPQMLVSTGEIKERAIRFHEDRNRLTRVLGMEWEAPKYTLAEPCAIQPGMAFLMCSDGFWELIDEKEMAKLYKRSTGPGDWLEKMEAVVLKNGAGKRMDNYSAIAVWVS